MILLALACVTPPGLVGIDDPIDADEDGSDVTEDCDDLDPRRAPGLAERCDGIDNDCDGGLDLPECERSEAFVQTMSLDLLLVIDDSISMDEELAGVAASFPSLFPWIVGDDYDTHVGVITMDMDDPDEQGRLIPANGHRFLDRSLSTEEALDWANAAIQRPLDAGLYSERALDAAKTALYEHSDAENSGFRRSDAHLSMVFVSDEDDEDSSLSALPFIEAIRALPGAGDFTAHAVVSRDEACLQLPGHEYLAVAALTGGLTESICAGDYGQFLSAVGQVSAQQGLHERFLLEGPAQADSIDVRFEVGNEVVIHLDPEDHVLAGDHDTVVLLVPPPPAGSRVLVDYRILE
ncbi:MAG: putative metal-binding motif-containing protein [Myxococcota bacterium]